VNGDPFVTFVESRRVLVEGINYLSSLSPHIASFQILFVFNLKTSFIFAI
jgi:hypothetical protein